MSNIQASNQPNSSSDSQFQSDSCDAGQVEETPGEEPEPVCQSDPTAFSIGQRVDVDIIWDEAVGELQGVLGISNETISLAVDRAARHRGFQGGSIGVRLTNDESIHQINRRHLSHDYPTDVISFPYEDSGEKVEGELVASVETAIRNARDAGWDAASELLLYIIHGVLHVCGMDDQTALDRSAMRLSERTVLAELGLVQPEPKENANE